MNLFDKVYFILQTSGLLICIWLSFYALASWRFPAGRASAAMLASTGFILATNTIGWLVDANLDAELFWVKIGYLGMSTLPVSDEAMGQPMDMVESAKPATSGV